MGGDARHDARLLRDPRDWPKQIATSSVLHPENGTKAELATRGFDRPQIVVINGMTKPNVTLFGDHQYKKHVRALGDDYLSTVPRRVAS